MLLNGRLKSIVVAPNNPYDGAGVRNFVDDMQCATALVVCVFAGAGLATDVLSVAFSGKTDMESGCRRSDGSHRESRDRCSGQ